MFAAVTLVEPRDGFPSLQKTPRELCEREKERLENLGDPEYCFTIVCRIPNHHICLEIALGNVRGRGREGRPLSRLPADAAGFKSTTCTVCEST